MEGTNLSISEKTEIVEFKIKEAYDQLKHIDLSIAKYEFNDGKTTTKVDCFTADRLLSVIDKLENLLSKLKNKK